MTSEDVEERAYWVSLSSVPGIGSKRFFGLVEWFGSARAAWGASAAELEASRVLPAEVRQALLRGRERSDPFRAYAEQARTCTRIVTALDAAYPCGLLSIAGRPPVLYVLGDPECLEAPSVAVVGTRKPTPYGREMTSGLVREIARAGVTVISGLAVGIDTVAHRAALEAGGRTVAVLGSGLGHLYPPCNSGLAREMVSGGGAVISQFPSDTIPGERNFVARNRVVAGMALGVVVTEAPSGSGALLTASAAREFGRVVMAVPGPLTSPTYQGSLECLRLGGKAVGSGSHVLVDIGIEAVADWPGPLNPGPQGSSSASGEGQRSTSGAEPSLTPDPSRAITDPRGTLGPDGRMVLDAIGEGEAVGFGVLTARTGLKADRLGAVLGVLEVMGLVVRLPGDSYARRPSPDSGRTPGTI